MNSLEAESATSNYYATKSESLKDIFGAKSLEITSEGISVDGVTYPVIDDVIILLDPSQYTDALKERLGVKISGSGKAYAKDIQSTFGAEWETFAEVLPEHKKEFSLYFDIVDPGYFEGKRACDLGCGIGRWGYFLAPKVKELVLVDFSDAIFVARENLKNAHNAFFFMGDIQRLPFKNNFADFIYSLGVLHHLPTSALQEIKSISRYAPALLIYIYYSLDNRPIYFRWLLRIVSAIRTCLSRLKNRVLRSLATELLMWAIYIPIIVCGWMFSRIGLGAYIPMHEYYRGMSLKRIRQDVYDRFFTRIEQRFSRETIQGLDDCFRKIIISDGLPYWHFLCLR